MELRHLLRSISLEEILNCPFENDLQNSYSIHTINCPKNAPFVVFRSTQQQQQMDKKWRRYPSNNKWNFRLKSLIWINWFRIYFSCRPSEWPPVFWGHLLTSGQHGQPGRRHPARAEANLFKFISINLFSLASSFFSRHPLKRILLQPRYYIRNMRMSAYVTVCVCTCDCPEMTTECKNINCFASPPERTLFGLTISAQPQDSLTLHQHQELLVWNCIK